MCSSNIMLGNMLPLGTGFFDLFLNVDKLYDIMPEEQPIDNEKLFSRTPPQFVLMKELSYTSATPQPNLSFSPDLSSSPYTAPSPDFRSFSSAHYNPLSPAPGSSPYTPLYSPTAPNYDGVSSPYYQASSPAFNPQYNPLSPAYNPQYNALSPLSNSSNLSSVLYPEHPASSWSLYGVSSPPTAPSAAAEDDS